MITEPQIPGAATLEELRIYWRMASLRATRELANRLGLRRTAGRCPWFAIWAAEGLAAPAPRLWAELKLPHMTTQDIAGLLKGSRRTAQRMDQKKPDASFPERLRFRNKPKLWRQAQVNAWAAGLLVPVYKKLPDRPRRAPMEAAPTKSQPSEKPSGVFNPFLDQQFSDV
ncbi:MAG: hypothetical protein QNK42_18130 [Pseudodonghicola sp.]|nr:hypothetical protein [Pseudodonghicola sp.]